MPQSKRKVLLAVKQWGSEESIHSWKYLKAHLLQSAKDGLWSDELVVVHIAKGKEKEKERWDQGGAVIASLQTALQPYKHDVFDLEGEAGPLLVDICNKEQADILVLATRGRNVMKKAMMGSMTEFVIQRVNCACLVVKPQVGAGDTYRMKSAAQPQGAAAAAALHAVPNLQPPRAHSPASSPVYRLSSLPGTTPFNRRVAIAYDTTASGRYLLKWAADTILEPADNVFVVRAVPKMRKPGTSFADKNSVQRLAGDALQGQTHITTFNMQQQGNARKSVLNFVAKESVDLLVIGMYKPSTRRKGLALRGNALMIANRCACPCLVVPMTEAALQACVKATDLELAAAEEEELDSGSETDSEDEEPAGATSGHHNGLSTPTPGGTTGVLLASGGSNAAALAADQEEDGGAAAGSSSANDHGQSPEPGSLNYGLQQLRGGSAAAIKQIRAPLEALFKRRGGAGAPNAGLSDTGGDVKRALLLAALQNSSSNLHPGRYVVEVDGHGAVKSIKLSEKHHHQHAAGMPTAVDAAVVQSDSGATTAGSPKVEAIAAAEPAAGSLAGAATEPDAAEQPEAAAAAAADSSGADASSLAAAVSLEAGLAEQPDSVVAPAGATAVLAAEEVQQGGGAASSAASMEVQQLQLLLQQKEAEVQALQQQLKQMAATA